MLLLSSTLILLLAGTAFASIGDARPQLAGQGASWRPGELPDLALLVDTSNGTGSTVEAVLVPALAAVIGVSAVEVKPSSEGRVAILASLSPGVEGNEVLARVEAVVKETMAGTPVSLGGRVVADRDLLDRLNRSTVIAVVPVLLLLTLVLAASFGMKIGFATGGTISAATLLGGLIGAQMAGPFDGSLGTTALPAVLVACLVSTVLALRLLDWFKHPIGTDSADTIRRSVAHLASEAGLLVGGLILTSCTLAIAGPGRNQAMVVAVGAFFGVLVTFAVLPSMLVSLPPVPDEDDYRLFRFNLPDGRDFPPAVLAGFAMFLVIMGLFALRVPTAELIDEQALPQGSAAQRVSAELSQLGGDPTSSILATAPEGTTLSELDLWARDASTLPSVGWVATASGRFEQGTLSVDDSDPARFQRDERHLAVVTPSVTARSIAAQDLVALLATPQNLSEAPDLRGSPVDAADAGRESVSNLWLLVFSLAVAGALGVLVLVGDLKLALLVGALRVIGSAALLGVYHVITDTVSGSELQTVALVASIGVGLFELGFLRRLTQLTRAADPESLLDSLIADDDDRLDDNRADPISDVMRREGKAAMIGLAVAALCGLGFFASDLQVARRLGVALAVGLTIELLVGTWMLRPVLLGRRVSGTFGRRSGRVALDALGEPVALELVGGGVSESPEADVPSASAAADGDQLDPQWRRVVAGLLRAEFAFQTDPDRAELDTVFVADTPVFAELTEHNRRLRTAGFRVSGDGPRLLKVRAVNTGSPVTLAITVDHPERRLVDRDGRVLGVRRGERRDGMLWLVQDPSGRYRIVEAVDLGTGDVDVAVSTERVGLHDPDVTSSVRIPELAADSVQ